MKKPTRRPSSASGRRRRHHGDGQRAWPARGDAEGSPELLRPGQQPRGVCCSRSAAPRVTCSREKTMATKANSALFARNMPHFGCFFSPRQTVGFRGNPLVGQASRRVPNRQARRRADPEVLRTTACSTQDCGSNVAFCQRSAVRFIPLRTTRLSSISKSKSRGSVEAA